MYSFLLQDWKTLRLNPEQLSLTQSETDWVNMEPFQDAVFWLDVRNVVMGGGDEGRKCIHVRFIPLRIFSVTGINTR